MPLYCGATFMKIDFISINDIRLHVGLWYRVVVGMPTKWFNERLWRQSNGVNCPFLSWNMILANTAQFSLWSSDGNYGIALCAISVRQCCGQQSPSLCVRMNLKIYPWIWNRQLLDVLRCSHFVIVHVFANRLSLLPNKLGKIKLRFGALWRASA